MFCSKCGSKVPDGASFCPKCGAALYVTTSATQTATRPTPSPGYAQAPSNVPPNPQPMAGGMAAPRQARRLSIPLVVAACAVFAIILAAVVLLPRMNKTSADVPVAEPMDTEATEEVEETEEALEEPPFVANTQEAMDDGLLDSRDVPTMKALGSMAIGDFASLLESCGWQWNEDQTELHNAESTAYFHVFEGDHDYQADEINDMGRYASGIPARFEVIVDDTEYPSVQDLVDSLSVGVLVEESTTVRDTNEYGETREYTFVAYYDSRGNEMVAVVVHYEESDKYYVTVNNDESLGTNNYGRPLSSGRIKLEPQAEYFFACTHHLPGGQYRYSLYTGLEFNSQFIPTTYGFEQLTGEQFLAGLADHSWEDYPDEEGSFVNDDISGYAYFLDEGMAHISHDEVALLPAYGGDEPLIFAMQFENPYPSDFCTVMNLMPVNIIDYAYLEDPDNTSLTFMLVVYETSSGSYALAYYGFSSEACAAIFFNPPAIEAGLFSEWFGGENERATGNSVEEVWENMAGRPIGEFIVE